MTLNELVPSFEAILFAAGEPVDIEKFCTVFEVDDVTVEQVMDMLSDRLENSGSSLKLLRLDFAYQLCTKKEYAEKIRAVLDLRRKTPLSQAAFEVLAVVAYNQPVTKAYVEQVRGVDCSGVVSTLVEKGLLEEKGRLELPGRPLLYGTTQNFLRCFGLKNLDELPEVPADETLEDSNGQLKMLSAEVMELAQKMNDEATELAEDIPSEDE
ncbi:MAG: SMC-Scp complex subunit ScpB [Clostridia bacterium]|nr:SMC-Scp complex subunit ScpB [Clostridia bacterium]MBO5912110.1 SMC-Scp complex subunit ScpB [Clostridia bacterium]